MALKSVFMKVEIFAGPTISKELTFGPPLAKSFRTEYGRLAVTVEVVPDIFAAIEHINTFGSAHTDSIVTESGMASNNLQSDFP